MALAGPIGAEWVSAYGELLAAGATPLLLDPEAPPPERERWLKKAGGGQVLETGDAARAGERPWVRPAAGQLTNQARATVLLPSSGTSGAPKLVTRSIASLRAEGLRHLRWAGLTSDDRVLLPLPPWHAYALGWLHACFEAGCEVRALPPTALAETLREIRGGATVLPLVPATARLLAARAARAALPDNALRLAMVGAGVVDAGLDAAFREVFGIGLARDYGSTETGSLFSGHADSPLGRVGHPLDGVRFRIRGEDGTPAVPGAAGELQVALDDDPPGYWRSTGDLVTYHPVHGLEVLGRRSRAVRRGDRWVAPEEVETVLRDHPDVLEARVQGIPGHHPGSACLHASVVSLRGTAADASDLDGHAARRLSRHKVPERIEFVGELPRGRSGKLLASRRLVPADAAELIACAQDYKRGELLFALLRLGVLDALRQEPADPARIAARLGLDHVACEQLLQAAEQSGLLRAAPATDSAETAPSADGVGEALDILILEDRLSRSWVTRERIADLASTGLDRRAFDTEGPDDALRSVYQRAMHTKAARRRGQLARRLAGGSAQRLLEITCGPGRYAADHPPHERACLLRVGTLAEQPASGGEACVTPPPEEGERFDLVVVCNAIHLPGPGSDLRGLADRLAPGGRLLVDDVFLDTPGGLPGEVRLDWLTHGGSAWPTEATTVAGLSAAGFTVHRSVHVGSPAVTLLVAELASGTDTVRRGRP